MPCLIIFKHSEPSSNLTASTAISAQDLDDSFETARPYAPPLRPRGRGSWSYPSSRSSLGSHIMAQVEHRNQEYTDFKYFFSQKSQSLSLIYDKGI